MRVLALVLFFSLTAPLLAAPAPECQKLLLTPAQRLELVARELTAARREAPLFRRLVLKAMGRALESRVLEACSRRGLCTAVDVSQAVRENVEQAGRDLKLVRGYAIILGAWAGGMGFATYLNTIPAAQMYAPVTALLTGVGLSWVSAPVVDRVSSKVRRGVYGLLGLENGQEGGGVRRASDGELESFYLSTQATIGPLAQIGGQRLNQFLDSLDKKVSDARVAFGGGDRELALDQLAEIAVRMRELFPDVRPDHKAVARVVLTSFLRHVSIDAGFAAALRERIRSLDAGAGGDQVAGYYERLVAAWTQRNDVVH
ncbi:MAG: hypothetical protein HY075_06920 [Deltaproteobacteria bacterium]|nr:hypothetical protein [Deltaproteobacteria bacterium]